MSISRTDLMDNQLITCPLCSSTGAILIRYININLLINSWNSSFNINIAGEMNGIQEISLFQCNNCYLQFFLPNSLIASSSFYEKLEKFDWYYMKQKWEYDTALMEIANFQKVLEVGCGFGDFIVQALKFGICIEGIELNNHAVEKARKNNLPVFYGDLYDIALRSPHHYDAVCSFQVLEHVPNPREFIKWMCMLIKPGGKLILGIPNRDSFIKHQYNILDLPPHHLTRWSVNTLVYLHTNFNLELLHVFYEPLQKYHIYGYVDTYSSFLFKKLHLSQKNISRVNRAISLVIEKTALNNRLFGQSILASFIKKN